MKNRNIFLLMFLPIFAAATCAASGSAPKEKIKQDTKLPAEKYDVVMSTNCTLGSGMKVNVEVSLKIKESGLDAVVSTQTIKVTVTEAPAVKLPVPEPKKVAAPDKKSANAVTPATPANTVSALENIILEKMRAKELAVSSSTASSTQSALPASVSKSTTTAIQAKASAEPAKDNTAKKSDSTVAKPVSIGGVTAAAPAPQQTAEKSELKVSSTPAVTAQAAQQNTEPANPVTKVKSVEPKAPKNDTAKKQLENIPKQVSADNSTLSSAPAKQVPEKEEAKLVSVPVVLSAPVKEIIPSDVKSSNIEPPTAAVKSVQAPASAETNNDDKEAVEETVQHQKASENIPAVAETPGIAVSAKQIPKNNVPAVKEQKQDKLPTIQNLSGSAPAVQTQEGSAPSAPVVATPEPLPQYKPAVKKVKEKIAEIKKLPTQNVTRSSDDNIIIPKQSMTNKSYRVLEGDTLKSVSKMFYGDASRWDEIYDANKDKIEKGALKKDEIIIIP